MNETTTAPPSLDQTLDLRHSVRRSVNRALVQLVFSRVVVILFGSVATVLRALAAVFEEIGNAFFSFELEAARRYESLTGVRLGLALGRPGRYTDLHDYEDDRFPVSDAELEEEDA